MAIYETLAAVIGGNIMTVGFFWGAWQIMVPERREVPMIYPIMSVALPTIFVLATIGPLLNS